MLRKFASLTFGLLVVVALATAITHAPAYISRDDPAGFSVLCEPAPRVIKTADQSKAVTRISWTFHATKGDVPAGFARRASLRTAARMEPEPAPLKFPPLFHRPPPANS